ncbi:hypothetical protein FA13DRAFT_1736929 [Coprinellus micaceus]|uniref:Uncharacterized protein n=1 Tax=Coprinellus micaceus TaxID=71717 RepID=A0A4Y7SZ29_COPMI|nr:hypothetical protein FA13DRAFT_1744949 [Coprinellus micaceus]TEB27110.1 hypothetical protein FA13DRAFT_1736929 [Coprinellus micaceus]
MPPPLPPEILDTITDWVAQLEPEPASSSSLKSLALTSRQYFTYRAQSHLFRMRIVAEDELGTTLDILRGNTALFTHVRSLAIALQYAHPDDRGDASQTEAQFYIPMLSVLDNLHNATSLVILCLKSDSTPSRASEWATWSMLSPLCREMLDKAFRRPSINTLFILGLRDIPLQKIQVMPNLTMLLLEKYSGFTVQESKDEASRDTQNRSNLGLAPNSIQWMSLYRSGILAATLIPSFCDLPHLTLEIAGVDQHVATWGVLRTGPQRLESLALRYTNRVSSGRRNSNLLSECFSEFKRAGRSLPTLTNLRYLSITANAFYDSSEPDYRVPVPSFVPHFLTALITQNPQHSLEVMEITPQWGVFVEGSGFLPPDAPPMIDRGNGGWGQLCEALSNRRLFARLRVVRAIPFPEIKNWTGVRAKDIEAAFQKTVTPQAKAEMHSVLGGMGAGTMVDVGLDEKVKVVVDEIIRRILPNGFLDRVESLLS